MASMVVPYRHDMGGHCGSGALRDLTEWAGIRWGDDTPDEGIVFALGGALDFSYVRSAHLRPPIYLVGRSADLGEIREARTRQRPLRGLWGLRGL